LGESNWISNYLYTYILIRNGADIEDIKPGLEHIAVNYVLPDYHKLLNVDRDSSQYEHDNFKFLIQPLTAIHLKSNLQTELEPVGKILYIYIFIILAVIILIFSCLNFVNLATAQSVSRAKEVGIRKVAGSSQSALIRQFLTESSLLSLFALALALFFTELTLPAFSKFIGLQLSLGQLLNSAGIALMIVLIIIVGIFSGIFPALYFSAYTPAAVLRSRLHQGSGRSYFRTGLVLFELFIAVGAITMTLIIHSQYQYLLQKDLGYDSGNIVVIRRSDGLASKLESYKQQIVKHPGILAVTNSTVLPGGNYPHHPYYPEGNPVTKNYAVANLLTGYAFDSTYGIKLKKGRFFNSAIPGDTAACVINETAVKQMGIENPVGKKLIQLTVRNNGKKVYTIIGVVSDFNFETLETPIQPLVMKLMPELYEGYISVKLTPSDQKTSINYLKSVWDKYTAAYPFVYFVLDAESQSHYQPVKTTGRVFTLLSAIALFIAGLGLFAMVSYTFHRRKRIIGLQKALGANSVAIIAQKTFEIIKLNMAASVFAWIAAYFIVQLWFKDYAYHINLNPLYFIAPTIVVALMSVMTIFYHALLAVRLNPGAALRYE
jgi:putative ABC transport system permease protein